MIGLLTILTIFISSLISDFGTYDYSSDVYNIYPQYTSSAVFTAYTLSPEETDSAPCIGAGNINLCDIRKANPDKCIVATRLYPLHTNILVKGFGTCEVLDRTSKKYETRIDILFANRSDALAFGKKILKYDIQIKH